MCGETDFHFERAGLDGMAEFFDGLLRDESTQRGQFVHSGNQDRGVGAEMNLRSASQSEKKLVDVFGETGKMPFPRQ